MNEVEKILEKNGIEISKGMFIVTRDIKGMRTGDFKTLMPQSLVKELTTLIEKKEREAVEGFRKHIAKSGLEVDSWV